MTQKKTKERLESDAAARQLLFKVFGERGRCPKPRPEKKMRPRPITAQERKWLIRGLNALPTGEYVGCHSINLATGSHPPPGPPINPQPYLDQLDKLVVVSKCNCGGKNCHTVTFRDVPKGKPRTLVMHNTDDGRWLIITVAKDTQELAGLEID